jgi:hypothetical protein
MGAKDIPDISTKSGNRAYAKSPHEGNQAHGEIK